MNNDIKPVNCVFCGAEAKVIHFDENMWYVQCSNIACNKHDKYAYLGSFRGAAVEQWNYINRPISRISTKKKKKDDKNNNL